MRISDWSSDVCSSDLSGQKRSPAVRNGPERSPAVTNGPERSPAVTNGQKRAGASHRLLLAKTAEICFKFGHIECFPESRSPPMAETDTRKAPPPRPGPPTARHRGG